WLGGVEINPGEGGWRWDPVQRVVRRGIAASQPKPTTRPQSTAAAKKTRVRPAKKGKVLRPKKTKVLRPKKTKVRSAKKTKRTAPKKRSPARRARKRK
ncbi:MAG TPA: hypothetical protein VF836_05250, partial [Gemmatimonadaceae bacterium]